VPRVSQQPDRNSRSDNTCFAAADVRAGFGAGKCVPKVLNICPERPQIRADSTFA
jgi:hypothetical protein